MKTVFALLVFLFLYTPLFWYQGSVMRGRDFLSLSIFEMIGATFFSIMPLVILAMLDRKTKN
jgi:hypothetical protein